MLPCKIRGVLVVEDNGPVLPCHEAGPAFDPRGFAGEHGHLAGTAATAGIGGIMQHLQHAGVGQEPPDKLVALALSPPAGGEPEVMGGELLHDGQGRPRLGKEGEEEAHRLLDFLVRIEDHLTGGVEHESCGRPKAQRAVLGLFQLAAQEPVAQPVQLGFAHGAFEAQQQAIIVLTGVIDPLFINDEGIGQGTDFKQPIPIARRAGQAGDLQAEDGASMPQADLGDEGLEAIPASGGGPGVPLILVDDDEVLPRPPQVAGALCESILPCGAGGVFAHLEEGGLPDIDEGLPLQMRGADFRRCGGEEHVLPPAKTAQGRTAGLASRPS